MKIFAQLILLVLLLNGAAHAEVALPTLTHRVTDLSGTLDAQQAQTLEARLAEFEAKKGSQLALLIVPTTQPETIEQFGIRVVQVWKLGRKGVDDGALLLVAKDDRALRIEVGYGLEGVLNDATANRIIDEVIVPHFKRGEFYPGIESGLAAMMQVVNGEPLPAPKRTAAVGASGKFNIESLLFIGFGLVVVVGGMLRALLGRFPAALLMGGGLGVLAWLTVVPMVMALLVGVMAFVFVLLGGGRGLGGFGGGGFGGGGGGGFGGGGGGFGGGGASGRW
jgi:uncharacterized protein